MVKKQVKKFGGKWFTLYKSGATYGLHGIKDDVEWLKKRMQKRGWYVRVEHNPWGNTYMWIRRK